MKEAMLYERLGDQRVQCHLCAHECHIAPDKLGVCQVRENVDGTLYTLVYGRTIARHVDPIEKKPLFHYRPGTSAYSIAAPGCNFRCGWCQNAEISQVSREQHLIGGEQASAEEIVADASGMGCEVIAYTYTEPTIFFEFSHDVALLAREQGLDNVYVTNGYMTAQSLEIARSWLDAANVDLKAFRDRTYLRQVGARLQPVLDTLIRLRSHGIWLEVTTLIIPGVNDDPQELRDLTRFIVQELGPDTPWHVSRFFPYYRMSHVAATPPSTLLHARDIGKEAGIRHIYLGNLRTPGASDTRCHQCDATLIRRAGFAVSDNVVQPDGSCPRCGTAVAGVRMAGPSSKG